jgi:hypothetical protein
VFALVLTGPPGSGKSSVLEALSDALVDDDVAHATVETEALTSTHPPLEDAHWFAQVEAACRLHREQGQRLLLVATTVESEADLRGVLDAVGADEHVVVRLEAEPATLARRIVEREPEGWSGLDQLVAASRRLSPLIAGLDGIDLVLATEEARPCEVAARIRMPSPRRCAGRRRAEPAGYCPRGYGQRRAGEVELRRVPARRLARAQRRHGSGRGVAVVRAGRLGLP